MKPSYLVVAAVLLASAVSGATHAEAVAVGNDVGIHLRALEESAAPMESDNTAAQPADSAGAGLEALPRADAPKGELEQYHGGWGCHPGAWNWPQCRWGGGWGCYPGSWGWPRCRWQYRCHPGSWYWPRCRYW